MRSLASSQSLNGSSVNRIYAARLVHFEGSGDIDDGESEGPGVKDKGGGGGDGEGSDQRLWRRLYTRGGGGGRAGAR